MESTIFGEKNIEATYILWLGDICLFFGHINVSTIYQVQSSALTIFFPLNPLGRFEGLKKHVGRFGRLGGDFDRIVYEDG